jgi:predicted nucleic acid-binding Zn ribbon protein
MGKPPRQIGDVLEGLLKKLGLQKKLQEARMVQDWPRIVGDKIARHSRPVAMKRKVLYVNVDSSVWLAELNNFFKGKILDKVNEELGEKRIRDIRFRIGDIDV